MRGIPPEASEHTRRHPPEAAVVVPCFDAAATLPACLEALAAQTGAPPYEVIVVDNGSRDQTATIAREAAARSGGLIRVLAEPRPGSYAARNAGLRATEAPIVLFTDADCVPGPTWVSRLAAAFRDPRVLAAGGEIEPRTDQPSLVARHAARAGILSQSNALAHPRGGFLQTASLAVRRADALAIGGFDEGFLSGGDADFCWRLRARRPEGEIRVVEGAAVAHHHRESLRALWRQYRRYGQADVALARRHGIRWPVFALKLGADAVRVLALPLLMLAMAPASAVRRDALPLLTPFFRAWRSLARRSGQIGAWLRPGRRYRT